jgi:hypothetical protein
MAAAVVGRIGTASRGAQATSSFASSSATTSATSNMHPFVSKFATPFTLAYEAWQLGSGAFSLLYACFGALFGIIVILYYFGDCLGMALKPVYIISNRITKALDRYDALLIAADPLPGQTTAHRMENWLTAFLAYVLMLVPRMFEFVIGFAIAEFLDFWVQAIFLGLGIIFIALQMQLASLTGFVVSGSKLASSAANAGGTVFNMAIDASHAMLPIYNTNAGQTALFYSELSELVQATLNVPSSTSGRRLSMKAGGTFLDATFEELTAIAKLLAVRIEVLATVNRLVLLIVIAIALVSFEIILAVVPGLAQTLTCAALDSECAVREVFAKIVDIIGTIINSIASVFGSNLDINGDFLLCQSSDYTPGISNSCSGANGGPFTNQAAGDTFGYTCTQTSSGYTEYANQGQNAVATTSGTNPTTACHNSRRALTVVGALLNSQAVMASGGARCFFVDLAVNGTRWEVCPPPLGDFSLDRKVTWTLQGGGSHGRRLASASEARAHLSASLQAPVTSDVRVRRAPPASSSGGGAPRTTEKVQKVLDALERVSQQRMHTTYVMIGNFRVACGEMGITPGMVSFQSYTHLAISTACVFASFGPGMDAAGESALDLEEANEKVRAKVDAHVSSLFTRLSPLGKSRRVLTQEEKGGGEDPVTKVLRSVTELRTRYAVAVEASRSSGRSLAEEVAATSPMAKAVAETAKRLEALSKKREQQRKRRLSTESASPTSAPTRGGVGTSQWGVFSAATVCGQNSVECPGFPGQCVASLSSCPFPTGASPFQQAQWGINYADNSVSTWDPRAAVVDFVQCPNQWLKNPQTNPAFHLGDPSNPGVLCYPQIHEWNYGYFPEMDLSLEPYLNSFCDGSGGCNCSSYLYGLENANAESLAGIATAIVIIVWNGVLAFWTLLTTILWIVFWGVNALWSMFFGAFPYSPPGLVYFWSTQGQAGSTYHRVWCAVIHLGELFFMCFALRITYILFEAGVEFAVAVLFEGLQLVECLVRILGGGAFGGALVVEDAQASAVARFMEKRRKQREIAKGVRQMMRAPDPDRSRGVFYRAAAAA